MVPSTTQSTLTRAEIEDRMRGCLFGNAIGDAYGLATEFLSKERARQVYGNGPVQFGMDEGYPFYLDFHRSKWEINDFTDDTDQLLVILQSLEQTRDGTLHPVNFARKLREWARIGHPENDTPPRGIGFTVGSVLRHPEFTTHPFAAAYDIWDHYSRNLAPNGAVMRTSVLGLESFWDEEKVVLNTMNAAKVTHADPRAIIAAVLASVLISRFLRGGGQDVEQDRARLWNAQFKDDATKAQYRQQLLDMLLYGSKERDGSLREAGYGQAEGGDESDGFVPKDVKKLRVEHQARLAKEKTKREALRKQQLEYVRQKKQEEQQKSGGLMNQVKQIFSSSSSQDSSASEYDEIEEWNRSRPPVVMRSDIGWRGIDGVGEHPAVTALARSVLDDYGFLVSETTLVPPPSLKKDDSSSSSSSFFPKRTLKSLTGSIDTDHVAEMQAQWYKDLELHLFPADLDELELGHSAKIGYALKCIGSGWYAVTRNEDPQATQPEQYGGAHGLFRGCLEQLMLEAGDADTNCAVAGALLGARLGLAHGIPVKWYEGIEHKEWLDETFGQFIGRVLDAYEASQQQAQVGV
ncbi:hypothetical protein BGZ73_001183 [Actinomortierella ambigua]|nr:hypothetical protein BGZ73_001183 [Actinomortierella ambigua]